MEKVKEVKLEQVNRESFFHTRKQESFKQIRGLGVMKDDTEESDKFKEYYDIQKRYRYSDEIVK